MIGVIEIIFSIIAFCVIWYFIFKVLLKIYNKKPYKNIDTKLEKQQERFKTEDLVKELSNYRKENPKQKIEDMIKPLKPEPKKQKEKKKKLSFKLPKIFMKKDGNKKG